MLWTLLVSAGLIYALPIGIGHFEALGPNGYYDAAAPCMCGHPNYYLVQDTEWFEVSIAHDIKEQLGSVERRGKEVHLHLNGRSDLSYTLRRDDSGWTLLSSTNIPKSIRAVKNPWELWVQKVWRVLEAP